jgi:hypothetical protein
VCCFLLCAGEASSSGQAQQPKQKQKGTKQAGSAGAGPSNAAGPSARWANNTVDVFELLDRILASEGFVPVPQ